MNSSITDYPVLSVDSYMCPVTDLIGPSDYDLGPRFNAVGYHDFGIVGRTGLYRYSVGFHVIYDHDEIFVPAGYYGPCRNDDLVLEFLKF